MLIRLSCVRSLGGVLTVALSLGLAAPAAAWNQPLWVRQLGTTQGDEAFGVAADTAGNVYVTGTTYYEDDGDAADYAWAFVAKYDAAGGLLWKRRLGTMEPDWARGLATDPAGNLYVAGYTTGALGGPNRGGYDAWVVKVDADGEVLWKRQLGSDSWDSAFAVAADATGNIYLTGDTSGSLGGPNRGETDAWVAKYDAAGRLLWKRQRGTAEFDTAYGVATDAAGNVYVTGCTGSPLGAPEGDSDAWVSKYDAAGHTLWTRQLGTEVWDVAYGAATDARGNVYIGGWTEGALGGPNRGGSDAWLAKFDTAGRVVWKRQLGTEGGEDVSGVATDAEGNVYLTGGTSGALGGPNTGGMDAWVAKLDTTGHVLWARQMGSEEWDWANGVATDGAGSLYIAGYTEGSLDGRMRGYWDAFVAKFSTRR